MMNAGNANWWSIYSTSLVSPQFVLGSSSVSSSSLTNCQNTTHSWSQMLMSGLPNEEERWVPSYFPTKKFENWEDRVLNPAATRFPVLDVIKQEVTHSNNSLYVLGHEEFQASGHVLWSQSQIMPVSSPMYCVTSLSNSMFDFTENKAAERSQLIDHTSESNSTATASVCKKPRVQHSSQPPLKVRKEKRGDRITALHQLVSPFGKTDTASVLMEAIGYIRFLLGQIEALTSPYVGNTSNNTRNQQSVYGERNCIFPEDPGQMLNDTCLERNGAPNRDTQEKPKELRSRGLSLVPVSCTQNVASVNGADYWSPAYGGGF